MTKVIKLTAYLAPAVAEALEALTISQGVTISEAIRRAISTEIYLYEEKARGCKILVEERGIIRELIYMR